MTEKRPATASRGMVVTNHPLGSAPRIWSQGQELEIETRVPEAVRAAVAARGHTVLPVSTVAGGMNAVAVAEDGTLTGAACWRADGTPIGVSGGLARPGIRFRPDASRR